jgi:hypothetical protein
MNRQIRFAMTSIAVACGALTLAATNASATDGILCTDGYCPTCVCGSCDIFGCGCGDCGYMRPVRRACYYNWNGRYAHSAYGQPVALIVPPTANMQSNWGWGVASSRVSRMEHQVQRNYPGPGVFGMWPWRRTPAWPSDTTQFGVYYVRGPW